MTEKLKAEIKDAIRLQYKPNDKTFSALYNELFEVLLNDFFRHVEVVDLMKIESVRTEVKIIKILDRLFRELIINPDFNNESTFKFMGKDGKEFTMIVNFKKS